MDVLIVGAGPAGAVAATVLARAGVRVCLVDRATFPRHKLCGDSLNPGTLALLGRLKLLSEVERLGRNVHGMIISAELNGRLVSVEGRYPAGLRGRSVSRSDLDWALVNEAIRAGAGFEPGVNAREAIVADCDGVPTVTGVRTVSGSLTAPVTIAADGRRSTLAFGLGLAKHPRQPRRWAIGAYFEHARAAELLCGEMHIRRDHYIGIAPVPGGLLNVCVVKPPAGHDVEMRHPEETLRRALSTDPALRDRFADARPVRPPITLGPLAVDRSGPGIDGLILAGDAAGFVDPMTGDGLRFAVRGGELAALTALRALEHGWAGVHANLAATRQREFRTKYRFNRTLRAVVSSSLAVQVIGHSARVAPEIVRMMVRYAGDCGLADGTASDDPRAPGLNAPAAWYSSPDRHGQRQRDDPAYR